MTNKITDKTFFNIFIINLYKYLIRICNSLNINQFNKIKKLEKQINF
jgi:hypothetical protein